MRNANAGNHLNRGLIEQPGPGVLLLCVLLNVSLKNRRRRSENKRCWWHLIKPTLIASNLLEWRLSHLKVNVLQPKLRCSYPLEKVTKKLRLVGLVPSYRMVTYVPPVVDELPEGASSAQKKKN